MGLADILRVVVGLTGEPDVDVAQQLEATNGFELGWALEEGIEATDDPNALRGYQFGLLDASQSAEARANAIINAETIQTVLPQVENIIANWTDTDNAPREEGDDFGPIHELQRALDITADGVFGAGTARALLNHQTASYNNNFEYGSGVNLQEYSDTYWYSRLAATTEARLMDAAINSYNERQTLSDELSERIQVINAFIREEFGNCVDDVTAIGELDAFQDIMDAIPPLAQIAEEEDKAHEQIATAIHDSCGRFLDQVDVDMREELVASVAAHIEPVLREAIAERVNEVNLETLQEYRRSIIEDLTVSPRGRVIDPSLEAGPRPI